ncbi:DUF1385 domain-containing protein [bacterium]|nr:DUF1385 domain-containing protein [bacterium]
MFQRISQLFTRIAFLAETLPYGGQAAIEGVLMKGERHAALAVRRRDGRIEVLDRVVKSNFAWLAKTPLIRGFFILWDMMTLGMWAITESSKRYELDLEAQEREEKAQVAAEKGEEPPAETAPPQDMPGWLRTIILVASLGVALFIFKILPAMAATGVFSLIGWGSIKEMAEPTFGQQLLANTIEGLVKLTIFVAYIWSVGRLGEIRRVFEYHGAEHIVINAYERDADNQNLGYIQSLSTAHPRCGTSFIVILILLSIVLFTLLDWALVVFWPAYVVDNIPVWYLRWPLRILALPLLAGLSYEVIKAAFRYYGQPLITPLLRFGMLFQALTTRRPSDEQIEVSLASFNRARFLNEQIPEPAAIKRVLVEPLETASANAE